MGAGGLRALLKNAEAENYATVAWSSNPMLSVA